ncbi:4'-phosphopantetheinyl transferase family protein [Oceaniglobus roseus]|uniref:4'-phosphopantetheinyl transferase family protein n=1 Tax=Oceaniglobus roseus TaxID=1737570 RepID=UPI000C7F76B6|nr:4'-phosphopantetheinyl transferase superfamily protein [Kandeliimicrobium roseum]
MIEGELITRNPFGLPSLAWREGRFSRRDATTMTHDGDPSGPVTVTLPPDLLAAVPKRRSEFLAGRICAALALREAGLPETVTRAGRAPIWPAGAAGSISHTDTRVVAAVSRDLAGLGVDCEDIMSERQAHELRAMIVTPAEAAQRPAALPFPAFLTLVFSAKEALYKALSHRLDRILEFHDVTVTGLSPDRLHLSQGGLPYDALYRLDGAGCLTLVRVPR